MSEVRVGGRAFSLKEALHGNIITVEALVNILVKKGVCSKSEILTEVKRLQAELSKKLN